MKLPMKADYAFRVLSTLVEQYGRGPISIRELAERNNIPKAFLEHIMLELKAEKWVTSQPGKRGGYILAKSPDQITMGEIVRYFDGLGDDDELARATDDRTCPPGNKGGTPESSIRFRRVMREVHDQAAGLMDQATLASVFAGRPVSRAEVRAQEFGGGAGI